MLRWKLLKKFYHTTHIFFINLIKCNIVFFKCQVKNRTITEDFGGSIEEEEQEDIKDEATVSKITFEFDPEMCVSILARLENFRKSEELQTKEQVFLRILEMSGI